MTYSYDLNGNLVSKTADGNTTSYGWDWNNHLLSVTEPSGNTAYEYDGDGTRISKTQAGVKTKYINDVARGLVQVIMETDNTGTAQAIYNYGMDLISMNRASVNSFYHYDGLGSARQLTDSSGAVAALYIYDGYGNLIASSGSITNAYGFTGEQQFSETDNLVYLRARYYDSKVGRFISRDPIGYFDGMNLYIYTNNNPINYIDPEGKLLIDPHTVACIVCGLLVAKDIIFLLTDCIKEASDAECPTSFSEAFADCIKKNWIKGLIPESKWEKIAKSVSCGICFGGWLPKPVPVPVPVPIPAG